MEHDLKTWPAFFPALLNGKKTFEVRRNDRDFRVEDILILREWDPTIEDYTGRVVRRVVTYLARAEDLSRMGSGLREGFCVMAISKIEKGR